LLAVARKRRLRSGGGEFVLADGEQFVVAKGFELGLEDIDHRHRVTQGIEDLEVVTVFGAVTFVLFHRGRHVAATQSGARQIDRQGNSAIERKGHIRQGNQWSVVSVQFLSETSQVVFADFVRVLQQPQQVVGDLARIDVGIGRQLHACLDRRPILIPKELMSSVALTTPGSRWRSFRRVRSGGSADGKSQTKFF
jgi:hypothetical protein